MSQDSTNHTWPFGQSKIADLLRAETTVSTLGPKDAWSANLKTAIQLCFDSHLPRLLYWGTENLVFFNDALANMMKISNPEIFLAKPATSEWLDNWNGILKTLSYVKTSGQSATLEDQPFGDTYFTLSFTAMRDTDGTFQGVMCTHFDTTQKVISQRIHEYAIAQFQELANTMPQHVWTAGVDGNLDYFNEAWYQYSGSHYDENAGVGWVQFVHPDDLPSTAKLWQTAIETQTAYSNQFRLRNRNQLYRWHLVRAMPIFDRTNGKIKKWVGTNTDIHESKVATEALNLAIEAGSMGTWHIDLRSLDVNVSTEFVNIFETDAIGGNIFEEISRLMHPDDIEEVNRIWQKAVSDREPYSHEYRIVTKTGKTKWVHSRGQASYSVENQPISLSGILFDITEKKLAQEKLEKLAKDLQSAVSTRDDFMSIASHELKTPLTSLSLQLQSIQRNVAKNIPNALSPEITKKFIENANRQVNRLSRLVDDMLDITRIESGKLSTNIERVDLAEIILDVYSQLKEQIENSGCPCDIEVESGALGPFDRARIEQVVTNLLTNAMKYGKGSPISIRFSRVQNQSILKITDHGIGITPENALKVFERFERIVSANEVSGLGLGLFITREIVLLHGGKIWVESTLGKGSSFYVQLPLEAAEIN